MLETELGNRIKEARIGNKLSQLEISKKLKITDKTYRNYEKGNNITVYILKKIAEITNTDFYYLLDGEKNQPQSKANIPVNFQPEVHTISEYITVNTNIKPILMYIDKTFLDEVAKLRKYDKLDIIRVHGNSMEPFISNGEYVIIEKNSDAKNGEIVIANINGEVYIKKFLVDPFKKWIKLLSDNNNYDEIHIDGDNLQQVSIVGIVIAKIKPF